MKKIFGKFSLLPTTITSIYLMTSIYIYIKSVICTEFLCGLIRVIPIIPFLYPFAYLSQGSTIMNYFLTAPLYFVIVGLHGALLYWLVLKLTKLVSRIFKKT